MLRLRFAGCLTLLTAVACYHYPPPTAATHAPSDLSVTALNRPSTPDAIAIADVRTGRGSRAFTLVDGTGHELTSDELMHRYESVVGVPDVRSTFIRNHHINLLTAGAISLAAATVAGLGIAECSRRPCDPLTEQHTAEGAIAAGLMFGGTIYGMTQDPLLHPALTRSQAEEIVRVRRRPSPERLRFRYRAVHERNDTDGMGRAGT